MIRRPNPLPTIDTLDPDVTTSTIRLAGARLPVVAVVCPPVEGYPEECDWCRHLGSVNGETSAYVPLENGLLYEITALENGTLDIHLNARTCELLDQYHPVDDPMWLPWAIALRNGALETRDMMCHRQVRSWNGAEPEWALEHLRRMAALPFTQPPGPAVQLHRLGDELVRGCDGGTCR